jgi:arginyl-tRNA synthetase
MNIKHYLDQVFSDALSELSGSDSPGVVKQAQRPEFGHYQANGIMGAAKKAGTKPRDLAAQVQSHINLGEVFDTEIAGPGFINIRLKPSFIANEIAKSRHRVGIRSSQPRKVVVDYSAPNLAKEMHVGHLRTTTIGDAMVRILEFLGHEVVRANHVGDWGAQFGSLLAYMDQLSNETDNLSTELKDLEKFYQAASALFRSDEVFAERARNYVVRLQSGDERCLALWQQFITESIRHCQTVYEKFNITLAEKDIRAESAYNDDLPVVVDELTELGLLEENEGAMCVFLDQFTGKDGKPLPAIVRKSDGGYPYMASDLAAVRYRVRELNADTALYVVGSEQKLHLQQVFAVAKAAGYINEDHDFRHLPFGMVTRPDGTRFKTRDGADVKLIDVLDEAVARARVLVAEKNPDLSAAKHDEIARVVGIGAVKYAELSKNRTTDYVFDWDTMLSFEGNTAPYLQYAYTRIRSIFRRADISASSLEGDVILDDEYEIRLAVKLLQFAEAVDTVLDDYQANVLCLYLYELSGLFMSFYEQCQVLGSEEPIRTSRLLLCDLTARTLNQGLQLLGIETVEQM